jgi:hypothetical protein
MDSLDKQLAEAREGIMPNDVSEMAASHRRAFDACAAIAREVVAEKDAQIARIRSEASNEEAVKTALLGIVKCMDYTATLAVFDATKQWMHDRHAWKNYFAEALLVEAQRRVDSGEVALAQTRKVTDAQRERIATYLESRHGTVKNMAAGIVAILESTDEPAAK